MTDRRKEEAGVARWHEGAPTFVPALGVDRAALSGAYGPFASRASFRAALRALCAEHRLCARRLGLERGSDGPCFARQLHRCNGVCAGAESPHEHDVRVAAALAPLAIPAWPLAAAGYVREASDDGERVDVHVFRDWCFAGTARNDAELAELVESPPRTAFDPDVTRLLLRRYRAGTLNLRPVGGA